MNRLETFQPPNGFQKANRPGHHIIPERCSHYDWQPGVLYQAALRTGDHNYIYILKPKGLTHINAMDDLIKTQIHWVNR